MARRCTNEICSPSRKPHVRCRLRLFGIPINGYANVFCDNEAIYKNTSFADSMLKKKHNSGAHHKVRECTAAVIL